MNSPHKRERTPLEIAERLEAMAQSLKAISDSVVRGQIIDEMRTLLNELEQREDL